MYQHPFSFNFIRKGACSQFIYSCVCHGVGKLQDPQDTTDKSESAGEKDPDRGSEKTDKITEQLANADLKDTGSEDIETEEM